MDRRPGRAASGSRRSRSRSTIHICPRVSVCSLTSPGVRLLPDNLGQDEYELLARIAHRYYADGRTQEEIAREFGLSRPKVQRLLERARWSGVVDIHIEAPPWLNLDLEAQLREPFHLSDAIVGPAAPDPPSRSARRWPAARPGTSSGGLTTVRRRRQPRPRHRRGAALLPARAAARLHVRERHGRLAARGRADQPQRDLPGAGRARWAAGPSQPVRAGVRRERRDARPAAGAGGRRRHAASRRPGRRSRSSASAAPTMAARWSAAAASRQRRSPGCVGQGAVGDVLGNYVDAAGQPVASAAQRSPGRPLDRGPAPDRDRGRGRERVGEAARDPRRPACGRRGRPRRRRGQRPCRARPRRGGEAARHGGACRRSAQGGDQRDDTLSVAGHGPGPTGRTACRRPLETRRTAQAGVPRRC